MGNSRSKKAPLEPISLEPVSLARHHKGNIAGGEGDGPSDYSFPYSNADGDVIKRERSCTDVPCLLIFGAFLAAWTGIAVIAVSNGDINKALLPTDSSGQVCGRGAMSHRKLLFVFDLTQCLNPAVLVEGCLTPQVCVSSCPTTSYSPLAAATAKLETEESIKEKMAPFCAPQIANSSSLTVKELVDQSICPAWYLSSTEILGRCLPSISAEDEAALKVSRTKLVQGRHRFSSFLAARHLFERVLDDLRETYWMIGIALLGASLLSLIWLVLMRFVAGPLIYSSIIAVILGLTGLLVFCSIRLRQSLTSTEPEAEKNIFQLNWTPEIVDDLMKQQHTWLAFTCILGVLLFLSLCLLAFLWKRIRIAVALIEEGSKALGQLCLTLFFPLIPFLLQVLVAVWFLTIALSLSTWSEAEYRLSSADPEASNCLATCPSSNHTIASLCSPESFASCQQLCPAVKCQFVRYTRSQDYSWMQIVNVFGLFWGISFFSAFEELVLARVFAEWYWTRNKALPSSLTYIGASLYTATVFHLGTVAFGSLLVAIISFIRMVLEYVEKKYMTATDGFVKNLLWFCKCCLWCLEKFIRFINRNAYIMCAVKSSNFCKSARDAFNLLMRNVVRVVVLDNMVSFLLFLGKMAIVIITGTVSYAAFSGYIPAFKEDMPSLNFFYTPVIIIVLGSYFIASSFFSVYAMAVDTLFLSFLEDLERNDGSAAKPYYMSKSLRKVLGKMEDLARERNPVGQAAMGQLDRF